MNEDELKQRYKALADSLSAGVSGGLNQAMEESFRSPQYHSLSPKGQKPSYYDPQDINFGSWDILSTPPPGYSKETRGKVTPIISERNDFDLEDYTPKFLTKGAVKDLINPVELALDEEFEWLDEYQRKIMSNNGSGKRRKAKPKYSKSNFRGSKYSVEQLLKTFDKIQAKEVGDIAITGSLALFLQGKITRDLLSDLDISIRSGEVQLDDEFEDVLMDMGYDNSNGLVSAPFVYYYNECLVDIFPIETQIPETVVIDYCGKAYLCVDYKHILDIKLKMLLPRMKDYKELFNSSFEMKFM